MAPQSPSKWAPWDLTQFSQSPSAALLYFSESHRWSEVPSLSKVILVLGKARSTGCQIWAEEGLSSLGELMFCQKLCTRRDAWVGTLLWWSCPSAVAHSCHLLNHPDSFHWGMFRINEEFDADLLLYSVILNATATQYTYSLNGIYRPHRLVQWSHCSHMCTPVHSPWLPGYINVVQTVLVLLTMVGLFPDRPYIHIVMPHLMISQFQLL